MKKKQSTIYRGYAEDRRVTVETERIGERPLDPEKSLRLRNHSPTGFEWGYGGNGPSQLALAILLDYYDEPPLALSKYQSFKREVIALLDQEKDWQLRGDEIDFALLLV